jgi:hypothetical protein
MDVNVTVGIMVGMTVGMGVGFTVAVKVGGIDVFVFAGVLVGIITVLVGGIRVNVGGMGVNVFVDVEVASPAYTCVRMSGSAVSIAGIAVFSAGVSEHAVSNNIRITISLFMGHSF